MDNFDLKKYLAEGRLLKETFVKLSDEQKKKVKDAAKRGEAPEDVIDSDFGGDDKYLQSVKALMDKLAEGKPLKENINFPELEDEFEGAMDAMVVEPKVYLQDIIDASAEEIVSDDYYEIMNAVEQGFYSAEEAVKLAKAWAKDKLSDLENKTENIQDEDLIASQAIDILDEFRVYAESEDLIQYLNKSMDYLERIPSNDDVYSAIQAVADGLNPYTGEEFDYTVDEMQSELERLIA